MQCTCVQSLQKHFLLVFIKNQQNQESRRIQKFRMQKNPKFRKIHKFRKIQNSEESRNSEKSINSEESKIRKNTEFRRIQNLQKVFCRNQGQLKYWDGKFFSSLGSASYLTKTGDTKIFGM